LGAFVDARRLAALVVRHAGRHLAGAGESVRIRRREEDVVDAAVSWDLVRSGALRANERFARSNTVRVGTCVAVAHGVRRFVLHPALDRDRGRLALRIGNARDPDGNELVIGRPDPGDARLRLAAIRTLLRVNAALRLVARVAGAMIVVVAVLGGL